LRNIADDVTQFRITAKQNDIAIVNLIANERIRDTSFGRKKLFGRHEKPSIPATTQFV